MVGSVRRSYVKGPQRSGGHDDAERFFMGARGAAAATSQVRRGNASIAASNLSGRTCNAAGAAPRALMKNRLKPA